MKIVKSLIARLLRREQTEANKLLWEYLRDSKFEKLEFRRQYVIGKYLADFFCKELDLIIEIGGDRKMPVSKDQERERYFKEQGYWMLRFKPETITQSPETIFSAIKKLQAERKSKAGGILPSGRKNSSLIDKKEKKTVLSTRKLSRPQQELLLNSGLAFVEYDAIKILFADFEIPNQARHLVFSSQNGVRAFLEKCTKGSDKSGFKIFCVGDKTRGLLEKNRFRVIYTEDSAAQLANYLIKNYPREHFYFFCGNRRRDELPDLLSEKRITVTEIEVYKTILNPKKFEQKFDAIFFFSPSGVKSYTSANEVGESHLICIGNTTAAEAEKYSQNVITANSASVESVIAKAFKILK